MHADIEDLQAWLKTLGRVDDAERKYGQYKVSVLAAERIEVIGIEQRLAEMSDPRIDPNVYQRKLSECLRFKQNIVMRRRAMPAALHGGKFTVGRKPGTVAPVRKAVQKLLERTPTMTNNQIWDKLCAHGPKGWECKMNSQGRYIEGPEAPANPQHNIEYRSLQNIVSAVKKKLKTQS